jgi:hypothetical protein
MVRVLIVAASLCAPLASLQGQADVVFTDTRVNLRRDPSTERAPRRVLAALERLTILADSSPRNGFLPVRSSRGELGWVAEDFVSTTEAAAPAVRALRIIGLDAPADELSPDWERQPLGRSTLYRIPSGAVCGARGAQGGDAETFLLKNRNDYPTVSYAVTFDALEGLPFEHGGLARDRPQWSEAAKAEIGRYEGLALTVTGFLAAVKPQGRYQRGEQTNCGFTGEDNTDWHVALTRSYRGHEADALVVEPTPRFKRRHPNWRADLLRPWTGSERQRRDSVRITGFLFYDPDHANHLGRYRRTMWELHPVARIELFENGAWIDLDSLPR